MINFERLHRLSADELAWFLMAYSDGCRCCVYKRLDQNGRFAGAMIDASCYNTDQKDTCIGGYRKWLQREPTEDDEWMFGACRNNAVIDRWTALSEEFKDGFTLKYENGFAVEIIRDSDNDGELSNRPFPF